MTSSPHRRRSKKALSPLQLEQLHRDYHRSGCLRLRDHLFEAHLNLVKMQANRMAKRCSLGFDELFQLGSMGLLKALQRFDPRRGFAFSTYAVPLINGQIQHYLRDRHALIRSPWRLRQLAYQADATQQQRLHAGVAPLSSAALAHQLGCTPKRLQQALETRAALNLRSLDAGVGDDAEPAGLQLADQRPGPNSWVAQQELLDHLAALPSSDQQLLKRLINGDISQRQLAQRLGWHPSCLARHLARLREQLAAKMNT